MGTTGGFFAVIEAFTTTVAILCSGEWSLLATSKNGRIALGVVGMTALVGFAYNAGMAFGTWLIYRYADRQSDA